MSVTINTNIQKNTIMIALAGNPNTGKTTLFNSLTGARQHVGNYPGVTVEKKDGHLSHKGVKIDVVDLPGTYSLTPMPPMKSSPGIIFSRAARKW
jgi:ferrous iron transport protein B